MAKIAPMAEWRPFTGKGTSSLRHDVICVHTMVGTLEGSWAWANQPGNAYWHFGLGGNGKLLQCHDLAYRSAANLYGNPYIIPIETADIGEGIFPSWSGSDVPAWTDAQLDKLVDLIVWLCKEFSIPPLLVADSKPGRRGIAYHRQGIDPWRVDGGDLWSKAYGKVCPGDRRIAQLKNTVIPRVQAVIAGPVPIPKVEDGMIHHFKSPTRPYRTAVDGTLVGWPDAADRDEFINLAKKVGVKVVAHSVSEKTFDALSAAYSTSDDLDAVEKYLASLVGIETREEQRDLASPPS